MRAYHADEIAEAAQEGEGFCLMCGHRQSFWKSGWFWACAMSVGSRKW